MFFWWICRGESGLPVLFLHHLSSSLYFSFKILIKKSNNSSYLIGLLWGLINCKVLLKNTCADASELGSRDQLASWPPTTGCSAVPMQCLLSPGASFHCSFLHCHDLGLGSDAQSPLRGPLRDTWGFSLLCMCMCVPVCLALRPNAQDAWCPLLPDWSPTHFVILLEYTDITQVSGC